MEIITFIIYNLYFELFFFYFVLMSEYVIFFFIHCSVFFFCSFALLSLEIEIKNVTRSHLGTNMQVSVDYICISTQFWLKTIF